MMQKDKKLLLTDLCARMPYFVECYCNNTSDNWCILTPAVISNLINSTEGLILKPYLRPMLSMTEEEKENYQTLCFEVTYNCETEKWLIKLFDWLNSHHFDYRGLIEKGLALEAPKGMYTSNNI